jgi:hypothetical protein
MGAANVGLTRQIGLRRERLKGYSGGSDVMRLRQADTVNRFAS